MLHVAVVLGTRPEAIKLAPVILEMQARTTFRVTLINSGQHREMLDSALSVFGLKSTFDLGLMHEGQSLAQLSSRGLHLIDSALAEISPDVIMVHGDTTTAFCAAVAGFYLRIPVVHVEAGLRTHDVSSPFPEELNRQAIARIATLNFAPTSLAFSNLEAEGVPKEKIRVTGNTVVDSSVWLSENYLRNSAWTEKQAEFFSQMGLSDILRLPFCLVTLHRRENQGQGFRQVLNTIRMKATENPSFSFVFPVHPNPNISEPAREILGGLGNVHLIPPVDYLHFSLLLAYSSLIISDSGGVQEEAVTFGKKVLIAREGTERPEGLTTGYMELVGSNAELIGLRLQEAIDSQSKPKAWVLNLEQNPFGKGKASQAICDALESLKL